MDHMSRELEVRDFLGKIFMRKIKVGFAGKTWEPDARRQDPVLYSVPCLVILLIFVATVINMEARKVELNMKP